ncbi:hypothetical protein DL98DRAFT_72613 [Cadophora sp. DSE1049]|nr:hypothetical protein DL98DRAFT_72613 [Cadophora sp. DSE1049]
MVRRSDGTSIQYHIPSHTYTFRKYVTGSSKNDTNMSHHNTNDTTRQATPTHPITPSNHNPPGACSAYYPKISSLPPPFLHLPLTGLSYSEPGRGIPCSTLTRLLSPAVCFLHSNQATLPLKRPCTA